MNTYYITFNNGLKRTIIADSHLIIETGNGINCEWFILNNEVICTLVDVRTIEKEEHCCGSCGNGDKCESKE